MFPLRYKTVNSQFLCSNLLTVPVYIFQCIIQFHVSWFTFDIIISLRVNCCLKRIYWSKGSKWYIRSYLLMLKDLRTRTDWPVWNICVANDHGYVPIVVTSILFSYLRMWYHWTRQPKIVHTMRKHDGWQMSNRIFESLPEHSCHPMI